MKTITLLLSLVCSLSIFASEISFKWNDEVVQTLKLERFQSGDITIKGKGLKAKSAEVYNPFRKYLKTYEGYDFVELLTLVYGEKWKEADSIRFVALDGFSQAAPVKKMLEKAAEHGGLLTYKESGHENFASFEKNGKQVHPGPFYLVWTNFSGRSIANYQDVLKWPYQLEKIVLVGKRER